MTGAPIPPGAGLRDRILRRAADLFAARGYHQTSTNEIAAATEVELETLFRYFASKAEIMNSILKHDLGAAEEAAERQRAAAGSPALRLYRYLVEDISGALRSPYTVGINATQGLIRELDFAGARARSQRLNDARAALIREGIEAGEFVEVDPDLASKAIEWTIEGSLVDGLSVPDGDPEVVARQIADLCLRAFVTDPEFVDGMGRDLPDASNDELI